MVNKRLMFIVFLVFISCISIVYAGDPVEPTILVDDFDDNDLNTSDGDGWINFTDTVGNNITMEDGTVRFNVTVNDDDNILRYNCSLTDVSNFTLLAKVKVNFSTTSFGAALGAKGSGSTKYYASNGYYLYDFKDSTYGDYRFKRLRDTPTPDIDYLNPRNVTNDVWFWWEVNYNSSHMRTKWWNVSGSGSTEPTEYMVNRSHGTIPSPTDWVIISHGAQEPISALYWVDEIYSSYCPNPAVETNTGFSQTAPNVSAEYHYDNIEADFNATGGSSVQFYINGTQSTTYFNISNTTGLLQNTSRVPVGVYYLNISANNSDNRINTTLFWVNVTDTIAPNTTISNNQTIKVQDDLFQADYNATDVSTPITYAVNDTQFSIDSDGFIENTTNLSIGLYYINITAQDSEGNLNTSIYLLDVQDYQDSFINDVKFLKYQDENELTSFQYAENITIRANVTDTRDNITFVNFTLISPAGDAYISNENGTPSGDFWNSTYFRINESGTWTVQIISDDDNLINETFYNYTETFVVTDVVTIDTSTLTTPFRLGLSENKSWLVGIKTDTRETLNFTFNYTLDFFNFTVYLDKLNMGVNSSGWTYLNITIGTNTTTTALNYSENFSINRTQSLLPFNKTWLLPISIEVTDQVGDIELVTTGDHTVYSCGGVEAHSYQVINNGNYELTSCTPFLLNSTNEKHGFSADTGFSLGVGETRVISMSYTYTFGVPKTFTFDVECVATPGGSNDTLTGTKPHLSYADATNCAAAQQEGGGGSTSQPPLRKPPKPKAEDIEGLCGNKVCETGETPWSCPGDCISKIWELDQIFCMPIFKCGNWNESWFINFMIIGVLGSMFYLQFRTRKVKRKI